MSAGRGRTRPPQRGAAMAIAARNYLSVVCEPCYDCKYTDCVAVCPIDCFWQDERMLYVHPAGCIDCEACVPGCPVGAIYPLALVPPEWRHFIPLNAERAA